MQLPINVDIEHITTLSLVQWCQTRKQPGINCDSIIIIYYTYIAHVVMLSCQYVQRVRQHSAESRGFSPGAPVSKLIGWVRINSQENDEENCKYRQLRIIQVGTSCNRPLKSPKGSELNNICVYLYVCMYMYIYVPLHPRGFLSFWAHKQAGLFF